MKIMSSYYNFIKKLYEKEESDLALALFRISKKLLSLYWHQNIMNIMV